MGIILISLIASNYALSIKRVEKSTKRARTSVKTGAYNGDGDYDNGFNCPGILAVEGNANFNEDNRLAIGKFWPKKLETPSTDQEKLGWTWDFGKQAPTGVLKEFLVPISGNLWYIPFRYFSSDLGYTNPRGYKYFDGWFTNDFKKSIHARFLLPWSSTSWYINDEQGNKIVAMLNKYRGAHAAVITGNKSSAVNAANSYISNKPLYDSTTGDASKLKAEKDKQIALNTTLTTEIGTKQGTYNTNQAKINDLESQLQGLRSAQTELGSQITSLSSQIDTITNNLKQMDGGASATVLAKTYQDNYTAAQTSLNTALANLKAEAVTRGTEVDSAGAAVLALKKDDFNANLGKIFP
jgi:hypothetical protein